MQTKKEVDFLDITLDLRTGSYKPYKKPNVCINYIHKESNHPPVIINNLPKGIELRFSNNSSDSKLFEEAAKSYHRASFRLPHKMSTTTLSEHVWNLKNNNIEHCISWEIIENSHPYNTASKKSNLCMAKKYFILTGKPTLNKRREIFAQSPHRKKHLLTNIRESGTARQSLQRP